ncbi:glycosyltransferase family 4 protein [Pseudonocardia sp.]|uniref:glycosyltransferase family 4 protein n=1 Tax=Pseudonocardia sp. TaxID=60912 RepID=UPI003D13881D
MTRARGPVVWASTSVATPGGMTTFVRTMRDTSLWREWNVVYVETHCAGSAAARLGVFARGLARYAWLLVARRPALVHLHSGKMGSFARKSVLLWLAKAARVPVVLHVHAGMFRVFYDRMPAPGRWYIRRTLAAADRLVALGGGWSERLREIEPSARLESVPNGIPIVGALERRDGPAHVVYLGRMHPDKGTYVLLDAWARVVADEPGARLTLAGNDEVERTREAVARLGLGGSVTIREWLTPEEVRELLATADVLTLPSRNEGQPMSVLEAMARGICVVATAVGGIPDLVEDGISALLVPPDDVDALAKALWSVATDADLRHRLGDAALATARERFDVEVVRDRFDTLYRELLTHR